MVGTEWIEKMEPPRFFKTHFTYEQQRQNSKAKYVYLTRNPLDVCVSFYYYTRSLSACQFQDGTFEDFFDVFVSGGTDRGDYFDHLMSWYPHRNDPNVFFITYENLKRDFRGTVLKLAYFLGDDYGRMLETNGDVYSKLVERSSIPFMKNLFDTSKETMKGWSVTKDKLILESVKRFTFDTSGNARPMNLVRKGAVGDWESHFSLDHISRMRARVVEKRAENVLRDLWSFKELGGVA